MFSSFSNKSYDFVNFVRKLGIGVKMFQNFENFSQKKKCKNVSMKKLKKFDVYVFKINRDLEGK